MAIPVVEPVGNELSAPGEQTPPRGRLHSALDLIVRVVGGGACAVAWLDAWSTVRSSSVGPAAEMEIGLRSRLTGEEDPTREVAAGWTTTLEDRDGETFAVLAVDAFPAPEIEDSLVAAARHVGFLLDSSRFEAGRTTAYEALVEVCSRIRTEELKADEILALIVQQARRLMEVDVTWLALLDADRERVVVKVASGARTETFVRMWVSVGVGVGGLAIRDRRPVIVRDHRTYDHPTTDLVRRSIESEGIVSMICTPMVFDGRVVGALYGGSRTPTDFTDLAVSIFGALAGQAAAAIVHSHLYRDLTAKNETLEQALTLHEALNEAALRGGGVDGIAAELVRLLERDVVVTREGAIRQRTFYGVDGSQSSDHDADVEGAPSVEIAAGSDCLGHLHAIGSEELTDLGHTAVRQAATMMALEMLRERAALDVEWRLRGDLLSELIQADGNRSEGLATRAARLGVDLNRRRALAIVEPLGTYEPRDLQLLLRVVLRRDLDDQTAMVTTQGERVLVAFALEREAASAAIGALLEKARLAGTQAVAGVSNPHENLGIALTEAEAALRLARAAGPGSHVAHDPGPLRFLLDAPDTGEMTAMVRDQLGPIARRDNQRGTGEILNTLQAYLELGNRPATAERCFIHVSTVKYRLERVAELLDCSLSDPQVKFRLQLAFEVRDILKTLGIDPLDGLSDEVEEPTLPPEASKRVTS